MKPCGICKSDMFFAEKMGSGSGLGVTEHALQDVLHEISVSYLVILGEEFGEFLMPPLRCFFLGDRAVCWSSSTKTKCKGTRRAVLSDIK